MNTIADGVIWRSTVFWWIAAATCLLLAIPLIAMQFTIEVNWGILDFVLMGGLLFGAGSTFVLVARRAPRRHWIPIGIVLAVVLLFIWVELAVGVFTNLGS